MAAAPSSSFLPSSGSTGSNMPRTSKSPVRSRFSKALPAPPPVLEKLLPSRSASRPSTSSPFPDSTPSLPPLPPASSALLSSPTYPYIPTASSPVSSATPQPPPKSSARAMPGTITSTPSPSLSLFPRQPPKLPTKQLPQSPLQQQASMLLRSPDTDSATTPSSTAPGHIIRRRPVASSLSIASSDSNRSLPAASSPPLPALPAPPAAPVSLAPRLPDLPSFVGFSGLSSLPSAPSLPQLPELPSLPDPDTSSETQSQTKTVRAPSPTPQYSSSRAASISSILSAYSEDSSVPAGLSSSNSEGTVSTNTSSYMAASSSPLRPLPEEKDQQVFLGVHQATNGPMLDDEVHTPLSYLLDEDYGDEEGDGVSNVKGEKMKSDDYDPYYDEYYNYIPSQSKANGNPLLASVTSHSSSGPRSDNKTEESNLSVAPPPSSKVAGALPPRSTSLHQPPADVLAKTVTTSIPSSTSSATSLKPADALPSLPTLVSPPSELWKRRSEKAETNLSVSELNLKSNPAQQETAAKTDTSRQLPFQRQDQPPPVTPSKGGYLAYRTPLPPPLSPLPPPPSRSALDQLQPPKPPPVGVSANGVSPSSLAPSPRIGLPGRDIRPSRQASPAVTPTVPRADAASSSPKMGASLSKLEAKVESTWKRKEVPPIPPPPPAKEPQQLPPPPFQRLPTPEYDDEDHDKQMSNGGTVQSKDGSSISTSTMTTAGTSSSSTTVVNVPVSPAASPAASSPGNLSTSALPPFSKDPVASIDTPRPTPPPQPLTGLVGKEIRPVKSAAQVSGQDIVNGPTEPQFAPRTSSRKVPIPTYTAEPTLFPGQAPSPLDQNVDDAETFVSEANSQVTIKAVAQKPTSDDPSHQKPMSVEEQHGASLRSSVNSADLLLAPGIPPLFPSGYLSEPVTPDTVFAAPPPTTIQFNCLQRHRDMFRDRNANYPLSCQACQTFERSMRWRCKWCYLRICSGCRDALHNHAKYDLAQLMAYLEDVRGPEKELSTTEDAREGDRRPVVYSMSSISDLPVIQEA